jgi:Fic family protein
LTRASLGRAARFALSSPGPRSAAWSRSWAIRHAPATTAIEGNTLTEDEVLQLIRGTLKLPASKEYLAREVDNIIRVANEVWQDQSGRYKSLSPELIREFNRRILEGLTLEPHVVPGESRTYSVGVGT